MNPAILTLAALGLLAAVLVLAHAPVGAYLYRVATATGHTRVERGIYRVAGIDPDGDMHWRAYAASVVAFSLVSIGLLWALILAQSVLPWSFGRKMNWHTALNTAVSFTTNTNWQSYGGEAGAGYTVQMAGLTVQNFVSAGVGIAVAFAVMRGVARRSASTLGSFWVDLVRVCLRVLLPIAAVGAILLLLGGVIQNLAAPTEIQTVTGTTQVIQGGPVASQEAIKLLGTNGGGFFNANSAHPFENPTAWTNILEILLILLIPFSLPRTYGLMVGDRRQGHALVAVMAGIALVSAALTSWAETAAGGASLEGKEVRFGTVWSAVFATATTGTSTGAVNSMHESYSPLGGGMVLTNMLLGEVSPGGVGTGFYGLFILAVIAVFIAGLMVGRTPELLGKTIGQREITYAALAILVMPALVLLLTAAALVLPVAKGALLTSGPHGLTEMMYGYASAANNNGSAFAGLTADQPYLNLTLALAMFFGRLLPIVLVLALAGSLAAQPRRPETEGTMPTGTPLFAGLLAGVVLIVAGLTFFPALALGPIAEALS